MKHALATALLLALAAPAAAQTPTPAAGPRAVLVGVARPRSQLALSLLGAPGAPARPLRIQCDAQTSAAVGVGSGDPTLSPDGAWVAYTRGGLPYARRVAGGRELAVMPPGRRVGAEVSFTGWSPDGARLLFHLHGAARMEGPEPVLPAPEGFYALELATARRAPAPAAVRACEGWLDATSLLVLREGGAEPAALVRAPLDGAAPVVLSALPAGSVSAVDHRGGWVTFLVGTAARTPGDSRVEVRRADGTGAREVSPRASWATYQHPRLSPDGAWVVYEQATGRHVGTDLQIAPTGPGAARTLTSCLGCRYTWESPASLLVLDRGGLRRVALDGTVAPVALPGAATLVAAGDRP